jgi:hypothetical protein
MNAPDQNDVSIALGLLPDSLDDQQKRSKIRNLTYELAHRTKVIENISGARGSAARWAIKKEPS